MKKLYKCLFNYKTHTMSTSTIQDCYCKFFQKVETTLPLDKLTQVMIIASEQLKILETISNFEQSKKEKDDDNDAATVLTKETLTRKKKRKLLCDEKQLFDAFENQDEVLLRLNYKMKYYFLIQPKNYKLFKSFPDKTIGESTTWNDFLLSYGISQTTKLHDSIEFLNSSDEWISLKSYSLDGKTKISY